MGDVDGDLAEPRAELRLAAKARDVREGLEEGRLHQILEVGRRPDEATDDALHDRRVRPEQPLDGLGLAGAARVERGVVSRPFALCRDLRRRNHRCH